MLHEDTPELRQAFQVGDEVGIFTGERDLADQVVWWLQRDSAQICSRGGLSARCDSALYLRRAVDAVLAWHSQKIGNV